MRKQLWILNTIFFASAALLAAGHAPGQQNRSSQPFIPGPANETQLAQQIRHNLLMLPYYSIFDDLAFQLHGSVVTLEGESLPEPPYDIQKAAEQVVKKTPGVTQVINHIKLLPLSSMDQQIRQAEAKAIYGDPEIGTRYGNQALPSIHIIVNNGQVTLKGSGRRPV